MGSFFQMPSQQILIKTSRSVMSKIHISCEMAKTTDLTKLLFHTYNIIQAQRHHHADCYVRACSMKQADEWNQHIVH